MQSALRKRLLSTGECKQKMTQLPFSTRGVMTRKTTDLLLITSPSSSISSFTGGTFLSSAGHSAANASSGRQRKNVTKQSQVSWNHPQTIWGNGTCHVHVPHKGSSSSSSFTTTLMCGLETPVSGIFELFSASVACSQLTSSEEE